MSLLKRARRRLRTLLLRKAVEREVDEEMRFHIEMEVEDLVRSGMSPEEARRSALRDFGGVERYKEESRDALGLRWAHDVAQDGRFALRSLRKSPGFAAVAVLTLGLGIGANTAVFSVLRGTLLQPLPYPDPDRIVALHELDESGEEMALTGDSYRDWREASRSFEAVAIHSNPAFGAPTTILGANTAVRSRVSGASGDFFRVMGRAPATGRTFTPEEMREGGPRAVVVSHAFWRTHLGGDPDVLGRVLDFWNAGYEVVGVMPPGFDYPAGSDLWVSMERDGISEGRRAHNYSAVGRLRAGVSPEEAQRELTRITAALKQEHGGEMDAAAARVTRLQDELVGDIRRPLMLLFGASALVLLVACTNLASTLLARGAGREREMAIRASMGAGRARLARQMLTEGLVLALLGAAAGLGIAVLVLRGLLAVGPDSLSLAGGIGLDGWVLGFTLLVAVATAVAFGLVPAVRTPEGEFGAALRAGSRGSSGAGPRGLWGFLVGAEVALAILLLIGSGLLIKSFRQVLGVEAGFDPEQVLTIDVSLPESKYSTDPRKAAYYQRLLGELERLPGVESAGLIQHLPLGGMAHTGSFEREGRGETEVYAGYRVASGGYFAAMGIPLLRGRLFEERDDAGTGDVAVVSQTLAERAWPGEDPIGKRVRNLANDSWIYPDRWVTVVGVVGDVRHGGLLDRSTPELYVHYLQRPNRAQSAVVTLRTRVPPASVIDAARSRLVALDPDVPATFATMSSRVIRSVADRRFTMLVLGVFSVVALLLAAVGIYGVVSYTVARRTREIGIRLALGAEPASVRAMVQRGAMAVALGGAAVGILGALLLSGVLRGLLYGVSPTDPATFAGVVLVLVAVAWLASWLPARRTTRVDPMITMRAE